MRNANDGQVNIKPGKRRTKRAALSCCCVTEPLPRAEMIFSGDGEEEEEEEEETEEEKKRKKALMRGKTYTSCRIHTSTQHTPPNQPRTNLNLNLTLTTYYYIGVCTSVL